MVFVAEAGGGGSPPPSVSIAPVGAYTATSPRGYARDVETDKTLDELIRELRSSNQMNSKGQFRNQGVKAYYDNLIYIRDHGPKTLAQKEASEFGTDDILDAIFYASAIASIVPHPAAKVGGIIGMGSSNVARAYYYGDRRSQRQAVGQFARTVDRTWRQYKQGSRRVAYQNYDRYY